MSEYRDDDLLMISGLQHYVFCKRQWCLIHQEQLWNENVLTQSGQILHERAHNDQTTEKRGNVITTRALPVFSYSLGIYGICDVVEWYRSTQDEGVPIGKYDGFWLPVPVEYKRGVPKKGNEDIVQVVAQALCLEEMLLCTINVCYLYYGETRRRTGIIIDEELRGYVKNICMEIHQLHRSGYTVKAKSKPECKSCSLINLCVPQLNAKYDVDSYIKKMMG